MPLPRDAAPTAGSARGTGGHDRLAALAPGRHAPVGRCARRPVLTGGGAGRRVLDPGGRTKAPTALPAAASPGDAGPRTGDRGYGGVRAGGTRARRACGGGAR